MYKKGRILPGLYLPLVFVIHRKIKGIQDVKGYFCEEQTEPNSTGYGFANNILFFPSSASILPYSQPSQELGGTQDVLKI